MKNNLANIKKAKMLLDSGYCIAIPTETVYGLAANAYSNTAVKKIYKLKKRPKNNPKNKDADNNFKVTTVALKSLGKLVIIKSKSINTPCCILLLTC